MPKNKNSKIVTLMCVILLILSLSPCEKKAEFGEIEDIEINETEDYAEENIFKPVDDDLGYEYKVFRHPRAYMQFQYPAGWTLSVDSARHLTFQAPADDPQLPGITIHVLHDFGMGHMYRDTVGSYGQIFDSDTHAIYYKLEDSYYRQSGYTAPASQETDTSFSNRPDTLSKAIFKNVNMVHQSMGTMPKEKCDIVQYYVKWADIPTVFSVAGNNECTDKMESLLTYMVSSITYLRDEITTTQNITYDDITIPVPSWFVKREENIFYSDFKESTCCSGMGVGIFHTSEELTPENVMFTYAEKMSQYFLPGKGKAYNNGYSCMRKDGTTNINGKTADIFTVTVTILPVQDSPAEFYTGGQTWYLTIYSFPSEDKGYSQIAIWSQDSQVEYLYSLRQNIETRAKVG